MVVSTAGVASKTSRIASGSPERKSKNIRSKEGCLTCRIRRKKCDQGKHADSCESCRRLHIECLGYSRNRPEWLKGVKVEEFKRTIKRFLAENSPKSGLHARQDASVPVPFLSFEGLRGRSTGGSSSMVGPSSVDYGVSSDAMNVDQLADDSDGSDEETPRHYQLLPLTKKEAPVLFKSPEPMSNADSSDKPNEAEMAADEDIHVAEDHPKGEISVNKGEAATKQRAETNALSPTTVDSLSADPELLYYVNVIFPVLHELAGFNLTAQELLAVAHRETCVRNVLVVQAQHHQNRIKFLTSTDGPHHQSTQKLCLELAASNSACATALNALSPTFDRATRHNDIDMLAVLYTLLHFGGVGELLTRHIARRGNQGSSSGSGFILELSCRWLASTIAHFTDLASALRRSTDRQRALIQAAINIDIYSSIALCRPPHFLDSYRSAFKHTDASASKDSNGVRTTIQPRLDDLLDIPAKTILAMAEMSAMASWKAEHIRHGSLSVMDLSRWAKRIDALLAPPSAESLLHPTPAIVNAGSRRPVTSDSQAKQQGPVVAPIASPSRSQPTPMLVRPSTIKVDGATGASQPPVTSKVDSNSEDSTNIAADPSTPVMRSNENLASSTPAPPTPTSARGDADVTAVMPNSDNAPNSKATSGLSANSEVKVVDRDTVPVTHPTSPTRQHPSVMPVSLDPLLRPYRRTLPPATREVFRCAGRVFLHTIISGEHPRVHDIAQAVSDTCGALRELGLSYLPHGAKPTPADDLRFPVVRGLPFCIFIAGSVAGSMEQGMFLRSCLRPVIREIDMQTAELLTAVLSERAGSGEANWQSVMNKRGSRLVFM